jgi:YspA, cpYpsA-related SLOG family
MRVLVCGGRDYTDGDRVQTVLMKLHAKYAIELVLTGAAQGADTLGMLWARDHEVPFMGVPAKWSIDGKAAGPKRNERLLKLVRSVGHQNCCVVAFPGGSGTAHMVGIAKEAGLRVWVIDSKPEAPVKTEPKAPATKTKRAPSKKRARETVTA